MTPHEKGIVNKLIRRMYDVAYSGIINLEKDKYNAVVGRLIDAEEDCLEKIANIKLKK